MVNHQVERTKFPQWKKKYIYSLKVLYHDINSFKKQTHLTQASNPWWWPMKDPKALGAILGNSSTNSNIKLRHLFKKIWKDLEYTIQPICLYYLMKHIYIYIYIKISSQSPKTVSVDYSLHRIYEENHINLWECSMYGYC